MTKSREMKMAEFGMDDGGVNGRNNSEEKMKEQRKVKKIGELKSSVSELALEAILGNGMVDFGGTVSLGITEDGGAGYVHSAFPRIISSDPYTGEELGYLRNMTPEQQQQIEDRKTKSNLSGQRVAKAMKFIPDNFLV